MPLSEKQRQGTERDPYPGQTRLPTIGGLTPFQVAAGGIDAGQDWAEMGGLTNPA